MEEQAPSYHDIRASMFRRNSGPFVFPEEWTHLEDVWCERLSGFYSTASLGLRSGLWLDHLRRWILFFWSHSVMDVLPCLDSLSCCINKLLLSFNWWTHVHQFCGGLVNFGNDFLLHDKWSRHWGSKAIANHCWKTFWCFDTAEKSSLKKKSTCVSPVHKTFSC